MGKTQPRGEVCEGCPVMNPSDCPRLSRRDAKPPANWGIDVRTIDVADRRCHDCGGLMAASLFVDEPATYRHPSCDQLAYRLPWPEWL